MSTGPHPIHVAISLATEAMHTGSVAGATTDQMIVGGPVARGFERDADAIMGLTTMVAHLLERLAAERGTTPEHELRRYAAHVAAQVIAPES